MFLASARILQLLEEPRQEQKEIMAWWTQSGVGMARAFRRIKINPREEDSNLMCLKLCN